MKHSVKPLCWDIFCNVIDNYGDIGVSWRLARQLAVEYGFRIRLWVDELAAFSAICPEIDLQREVQYVQGVDVHRWSDDTIDSTPGDIVIEAFACRLPSPFECAMAARHPPPVWINLDYLSAENWVAGCHALPSPHPNLPLTKYFFFPGFSEKTGGLLREANLDAHRQEFISSPDAQAEFWNALGVPPPNSETLRISLFAYDNPHLADLLEIWANGTTPVHCFAPLTKTRPTIEAFFGQTLQAGQTLRRGALELHTLPFISQQAYDQLLWLCDINFVRGEESFVRAQWAAKPFLWHIYPQDDAAHQNKLDAFLRLYCEDLAAPEALAEKRLHELWNCAQAGEETTGTITRAIWTHYLAALPELSAHADKWKNNLKKQHDLCSNLVRFCRSKL